MKKSTLLLVTMFVIPSLLCSCGGNKDKESSSGSASESTEVVLPDAPTSEMTLSVANFAYLDAAPTPTITGLTAENVQITYQYLNASTDEVIGTYTPGSSSIVPGSYKLKAHVTSSTYKPFDLFANFSVGNADFPNDISFVAKDFRFDEPAKAPEISGIPEGAEVVYEYRLDSAPYQIYPVGELYQIEPGHTYEMRATVSKEHYNTKNDLYYNFVVSNGIFDNYELVSSSISVGTTDVGFDLDEFSLSGLALRHKTSHDALADVTFSWKEDYTSSFTPGVDFAAKVVAHKEGFNDAEFDVTVNSTKKLVEKPALYRGESGTLPAVDIVYNGAEQKVHLEGLDEERVNIEASSVLAATNAGDYSVEVSLKDPVNTAWSDGTTANLTFNWELDRANPAGSSRGYRILIGDYVGHCDDTNPSVDTSFFSSAAVVKYEFLNYKSNLGKDIWEEYEYATFEITSSNAHFDSDSKLVVDDFSTDLEITVGTSFSNHEFSQPYTISFETVPSGDRALTFTTSEASIYGLDRANIVDNFWRPYHEFSYVYSANINGGGFGIDGKMFKSAKTVKMKFDVSDAGTGSMTAQAWFSLTQDFVGATGDVSLTQSVSLDTYDGEYVVFDFTSKTFDGSSDYYFQTWFTKIGDGGTYVKITELVIEYTPAA